MLPFSKRPPPPDEYSLRSGDFQAVRQDPYSQSYGQQQQQAPASYAPPSAFVRQAAPTPYGFTQQQQQYQYGHRNDLSAPPPPHSLAPMAMSADSSGRQFAITGTSRTNSSVVMREKPSLKWGVMIALSGALLGGVLGLGMDARRQTARAAAAAADTSTVAPPEAALAALAQPNAASAVPQPRVIAPAPQAAQAPVAVAPVAAPVVAVAPAAPVAAPPVVLAAAPPVVVVPKAEPAPKAHPRFVAPRPHGFVAAKVQPQRPAPEPKAEAPEPKVAKAEPKPAAPAAAAKKDASTSDAMKILEAANKDTTNTL